MQEHELTFDEERRFRLSVMIGISSSIYSAQVYNKSYCVHRVQYRVMSYLTIFLPFRHRFAALHTLFI